jgi:plastocyanin
MRAREWMPAAGFLAAAVIGLAGDAAARPHASRSTAVGVSEREYRIGVYRKTVPPGTVRFNVTNFGEDAHDFTVTTRRGTVLASVAEIRSARQATLKVRLTRPGTYRLLCTQLDHAARGMRATVVVRRKKK